MTAIASKYSFWHFGNFSAEYKRQFGELPSATLAKTLTGQALTASVRVSRQSSDRKAKVTKWNFMTVIGGVGTFFFGEDSGSGRGKAENHASSEKGGRKGGAAAASRTKEERSASAKKAAATRKRNEHHAHH